MAQPLREAFTAIRRSPLLTGLSALWEIPLPFTPVPITGQTFAVLLAGATLGLRAGAASQLLYLGMGIVGVPFFAGGASGWEVVTGPTVIVPMLALGVPGSGTTAVLLAVLAGAGAATGKPAPEGPEALMVIHPDEVAAEAALRARAWVVPFLPAGWFRRSFLPRSPPSLR